MNYSESGKLGYLKSKRAMENHTLGLIKDAKERHKDKGKRCLNCKKEIPYDKRKNKFCNCSCAAQYNNLGITRNPKKSRICKGCGGVIDKKGCYYCSKCFEQGRHIKIIPFDKLKTDQRRKKRILIERGNVCEICHNEKWMGKDIPLVLDHIDGNSDNNSKDNLRLVCGNCDMQLPTYKSKNKGKGRAFRRVRYSEGKSY